MDFLDPIQVKTFQEKARAAGVPDKEIAKYIEANTSEAMTTSALRQGMPIDYVPEAQRPEYYYKANKEGIDLKTTEDIKRESEKTREYDTTSKLVKGMLEEYEAIPKSQKGAVQGHKAKIGTGWLAPEAYEYEETRRSLSGSLKAAVGETGVLTDTDIARIVSMLPAPTDTEKQKKLSYSRIANLLSSKYGGDADEVYKFLTGEEKQKKNSTLEPQPQVLQETKQEQPSLQDISGPRSPQQMKEDIVKGASGVLPVLGGIVGGVAGSGIGAIGGVGVGAIPGGAIGTGVGTAAGHSLGESLESLTGVQEESPEEQFKEQAVEAGTAMAFDFVTAGLFKMVGSGISGIGKSLINKADDIPTKVIRANNTQKRKFLEKTGVALNDFMIEKGLFKRGAEQADEIIKPLQESFDDIALRSGREATASTVSKGFDEEIYRIAGISFHDVPKSADVIDDVIEGIEDESLRKVAQKIADRKNDFLKSVSKKGNTITVERITQLRKGIDKILTEGKFTEDPIKAGADRVARDAYQEAVREATNDIVGEGGLNIRGLGGELQKLYEYRKIAEAQANVGKTSFFGLRQIGMGGGGAVLGLLSSGDIKGAATGFLAGVGLPKLVENPKVMSMVVVNMAKIGKTMQAIPANQRAKFVLDASRRLLTNIGAYYISRFGEDEQESLPETPPVLNR